MYYSIQIQVYRSDLLVTQITNLNFYFESMIFKLKTLRKLSSAIPKICVFFYITKNAYFD